MVKLVRIGLIIITLFLSAYSLITGGLMPLSYAQLTLGLLFVVSGVIEQREKRKTYALMSYLGGLISLSAGFYMYYVLQLV